MECNNIDRAVNDKILAGNERRLNKNMKMKMALTDITGFCPDDWILLKGLTASNLYVL